MELTEKQLLRKINNTGIKNKKRYIIKYMKVLGLNKRVPRIKNLCIESYHDFGKTYEANCLEGLGFSWQEVYNNGEWRTTVYDILNNYKSIEDSKIADAIYELLNCLKEY